jgi:hypothetical protein
MILTGSSDESSLYFVVGGPRSVWTMAVMVGPPFDLTV